MNIMGFADRLWLNDLMPQNALTLMSGIAAVVCLTVEPVIRNRHTILLFQLAAGLSFAAHYAFLGITVASVAIILGAVQTGTALLSSRNAATGRLGCRQNMTRQPAPLVYPFDLIESIVRQNGCKLDRLLKRRRRSSGFKIVKYKHGFSLAQ